MDPQLVRAINRLAEAIENLTAAQTVREGNPCPRCRGKGGWGPHQPCDDCEGTGRVA